MIEHIQTRGYRYWPVKSDFKVYAQRYYDTYLQIYKYPGVDEILKFRAPLMGSRHTLFLNYFLNTFPVEGRKLITEYAELHKIIKSTPDINMMQSEIRNRILCDEILSALRRFYELNATTYDSSTSGLSVVITASTLVFPIVSEYVTVKNQAGGEDGVTILLPTMMRDVLESSLIEFHGLISVISGTNTRLGTPAETFLKITRYLLGYPHRFWPEDGDVDKLHRSIVTFTDSIVNMTTPSTSSEQM